MTPTNEKKSVKLDWTRLLGFDQASAIGSATTPMSQELAKIGAKPGIKPGIKAGIKVGIKSLSGC